MAEYIFRFFIYAVVGLSLEMVFSVLGIEFTLQAEIKRRVPKKYLEGFVSLYMIPIHGLGVLFLFEPLYLAIAGWHIIFRYILWGCAFVFVEAASGFVLDKMAGFYRWDYYELSKFKVAKRGYSLWSLLPLWGLYGLFLEVLVRILVGVSPYISSLI
jgi:uncharacterized membrane protein